MNDKVELCMMPQGIEIGRSDFGNGIRDYVAFDICFAMNTLCKDKAAMLKLLYSTADSIIAATNKAKTIWTKVSDEEPSPILGSVIFRYREGENRHWSCGLAVYQQQGMGGKWIVANTKDPGNWFAGSEWMAIPL